MKAFVDVYDVLPDVTIDYQNYWRCERDLITPALVAAGYQVGPWYGRSVTISYG